MMCWLPSKHLPTKAWQLLASSFWYAKVDGQSSELGDSLQPNLWLAGWQLLLLIPSSHLHEC